MAVPDKNYTKGSGKLYFAPFIPGTKTKAGGARYIGNTPSLSLGAEPEELEHYDSDNGTNEKDYSATVSIDRSGSFTTDHISFENLAAFFMAEASTVTAAGAVGATETIANVQHGVRYQIGVSASTPAGVRNIDNVVVTVAAVAKVAGTDYTIDEATGGLVILASGTIAEDASIDLTYDTVAGSHDAVLSGNQVVEGELQFIAKNQTGANIDYTWPNVKLRPDGDYELKGDDWQTLGFAFEVIKRDDNTAAVYINGRAA